jgi:long-subunit acyl-CoA synthetase (AMP-forming)
VSSFRPVGSQIALILHTSGTTSRPKAVPLRHANLARSVANIIATYGLQPTDRFFAL